MDEHVVYIPEPLHPEALDRISGLPEVRTVAQTAKDAEVAIVRNHLVDEAFIDTMPGLRLVIKHGAGLDRIDSALLEERGIRLESTPGYNANGVVELAILQSMRLLRGIRGEGTAVNAHELAGQRVALLGLGRIGAGIAKIVTRGFDTEVTAFDPFAPNEPDGVRLVDDVEEALNGANVVFVACPLTPTTEGMLSRGRISLLADRAVVVNTSRAAIVANDAMAAALESGKVRGYAHDFQDEDGALHAVAEPGELLQTRHVGGATEEALARTGDAVVLVLEDHLKAATAAKR